MTLHAHEEYYTSTQTSSSLFWCHQIAGTSMTADLCISMDDLTQIACAYRSIYVYCCIAHLKSIQIVVANAYI